jgi:hypothetical protein
VAALAAGLILAWIDTSPGFDDTGVLVGLLVAAGVGVVILDGRPSTGVAWVFGVLIGAPTPIVEAVNGGQAASIVALLFALAATLITSFVVRVAGRNA